MWRAAWERRHDTLKFYRPSDVVGLNISANTKTASARLAAIRHDGRGEAG
jgi:hypothetical protein